MPLFSQTYSIDFVGREKLEFDWAPFFDYNFQNPESLVFGNLWVVIWPRTFSRNDWPFLLWFVTSVLFIPSLHNSWTSPCMCGLLSRISWLQTSAFILWLYPLNLKQSTWGCTASFLCTHSSSLFPGPQIHSFQQWEREKERGREDILCDVSKCIWLSSAFPPKVRIREHQMQLERERKSHVMLLFC